MRTLIRLSAIVALVSCSPAAHAQAADEDAVKAVFLLRFAAFVEWPPESFASPTSSMTICLTGPSSMTGKVRRAAEGERLAGRGIQVRELPSGSPTNSCHVIYVGDGGDRRAAQILSDARSAQALIVTDARNGEQRGTIHFVVVNSRIRFHIDRGRAEEAGLRLSARLLDVALTVQNAAGAGGTP
jgi:hypothetical protein